MARCVFKPASRKQVKNRAEDALRCWVTQFEKRVGVTKNTDGSFDVKGKLDLHKEKLFNYRGLDSALIQKYIRFRKVTGRFSARPTEFFVLLPKQIVGDAHVVGNLAECIGRTGCDLEGRIAVTLFGW